MVRKKISLIFNPVWSPDMPHLGLGYLSSYLKERDIEVDILDLNLICYDNCPDELKKYWEMKNSALLVDEKTFSNIRNDIDFFINLCVNKINENDADILGFSVYSSNRLFTREVIKELKKINDKRLIVVGGRGVESEDERKVLGNLVDLFVKSEAEETLLEIIEKFYSKSFNILNSNIKGVIRIKDKEVDNFKERPFILPMDLLGFPKYDNFDLKNYKSDSLALLMGKGCVSKCAFCDDCNVMGNFRNKKAKSVVDEIQYHIDINKIHKFFFNDLSINSNVHELEKLCDIIIERGLKIEWVALAIAYRKMTFNLLEKMKQAGCKTLNYGMESGSDNVLKLMGKLFSVSEAEEVIKNTRKTGINTQLNFIVGFPGETEDDFKKTLEFIERNRKYISGITNINTCNALLESEIFKNHEKYKIQFPSDLSVRDTQWFIGKHNTPEIRQRRVQKVIQILKGTDLDIFVSNLWEEESKLKNKKLASDKKRRIVLTTSAPWGINNPPIGLAYLSEFLILNGIDNEVVDLNIDFYNKVPEEYKNLWHVENKNFWSNEKTFNLLLNIFDCLFQESVNKILKYDPDIIGFSVVDPKERFTVELIKKIKEKKPSVKIILGGPACSTEFQRRFFIDKISELIDVFVCGEGEEALLKIIKRIDAGLNLEEIPGTVVKNAQGNWHYTESVPIIPVNKIPFPKYLKFNLNDYAGRNLLVEWSRGCIGRCSFCKNYNLIKQYRAKPAEKVFEELKYNYCQNNIKEFTVCDPLLNGDLKQLEKICDLIINSGINIMWNGQIAPRERMDAEIFRKMKKAGCFKLQIGVESGSDKVLMKMRKIYTSGTAKKNIRLAKKAGIEVEVFIMIGFPSETEDDFKKTCKFIEDNSFFIDTVKSINTLHLIAGTDVYEHHKSFGIKTLPEQDWHFKWETIDGNNYSVRKKRGEFLTEKTLELGLNILETNLKEGKQGSLEYFLNNSGSLDFHEAKNNLLSAVNNLQKFKKNPKILSDSKYNFKRYSRPGILILIYRFIIIVILLFLGFSLDLYLWILKKAKKCIIFPGT